MLNRGVSLDVLRLIAVLPALCVIFIAGCTASKTVGAPPLKMNIAAGLRGGVMNEVASAISRTVSASVPALTMEVVATAGVDDTLATLQRGHAQLALMDSETAYVGYRTSARKLGAADLKTIAVCFRQWFISSCGVISTSRQWRSSAACVSQ